MSPSSPRQPNVGWLGRQRNPSAVAPVMMGFAFAQPILRGYGLTRIAGGTILLGRDDRTRPARGGLRPLWLNPAVFCVLAVRRLPTPAQKRAARRQPSGAL